MTVESMRSALGEVYPGDRWRRKVKEMPDAQVLAMYKRMEAAGQLFKHTPELFGKVDLTETRKMDISYSRK